MRDAFPRDTRKRSSSRARQRGDFLASGREAKGEARGSLHGLHRTKLFVIALRGHCSRALYESREHNGRPGVTRDDRTASIAAVRKNETASVLRHDFSDAWVEGEIEESR